MVEVSASTVAFQEELVELDELTRQAYSAYLVARDALFLRYEEPDHPDLDKLWHCYCEATETLERAMLETERFIGVGPSENLLDN